MSLADLTPAQKEELVVSLSALLLHDSSADISTDNLEAVIKASGNSVAPYWTTLFAAYIEKAGGVKKFLGAPGGGGGAAPSAGGAAAAGAPASAPKVEEKKVEEEEVDLGAGSMFGGGGDGY